MNLSKLNPLVFDNVYSLLAKHSHSESQSIFQLQGFKLGYHDKHKDAFLILFLSKILISLLLYRFKNYIKSAEIMYNTLDAEFIKTNKMYCKFADKDLISPLAI